MSYRLTDTENRLFTAAKKKDCTAFDLAMLVATPAEQARVASELVLHVEEMGDLYATYFDEFLWALGYITDYGSIHDNVVEEPQGYQHECGRCNECNGIDDDELF